MAKQLDARTLKSWLGGEGELALLDVREPGQYGESHLFHAVSLPYSRLELDLGRLVPRRAVPLVLCDEEGGELAARAARRAESLGYTDVHVLAGGTQGWKRAGYTLFAGVNVSSKTFGELVEHAYATPRISAAELRAMKERGENFVLVDGRTFAEYRKVNIPGGICCPNGELALRIGRIAPDPNTTIVVNCAGRTRSIVGAQTLRNFGVPNKVVALENGTQGWFLAGYPFEHGSARKYPDLPEGAELARLCAQAAAFVARCGVPEVDSAEAARWFADGSRTTYLLDVRTPEEYAAGHLAGAVHAPGGQLVQATDQWVGVRGARLVLVDGEGVRAPLMALWLRQLGHDAHVLREGSAAGLAAPAHPDTQSALAALATRTPEQLAADLRGHRCAVLDLRPSMAYRKGHIAGAAWTIRPHVRAALPAGQGAVVLIADEPALAYAAALDIGEAGVREVKLLEGGFAAWQAAGLPIETSPGRPADGECIDFLFFAHGRHEGNAEAAKQYLAWETSLIAQLDAQELAGFRITTGHA